jgi:tRNA (mo5U34)-methyltransferase
LEACGGSLDGKRVLDIACNCGGFSVEAARRGSEYVLGIDLVDRYIEQANFIKRALELPNVEFKTMDITDLDEASVGTFDVTFCFGILYHLEDPVGSMRKVGAVTRDVLVIDTDILIASPGKPLWRMNSPAVVGEESGASTTSLWRTDQRVIQFKPNERAVVELLEFLGFPRVEKVPPTAEGLGKRYSDGTRATFLARRA